MAPRSFLISFVILYSMRPQVLFVDWDGTLSNSRFWERWSLTASEQAKYQLIQRTLFQNARDLLHDWMCGFRSTAFVIQYVAESTGIAYDELLNELRYSCENMKFINAPDINVVQEIRAKGTKVIIATDNMDTFRNWTMPALKIDDTFDGVLLSNTLGAMKAHVQPDGTSMFFNHYLSQNNIQPHNTVLIDNSVTNKVVENFGMHFLHVNSTARLSHHLYELASAG
jgi:FMN phosphatase YigB (HAD superfamily)